MDLPAAALVTSSAPSPTLARRGGPQQSLRGLPSPARTQPPRTPRHARNPHAGALHNRVPAPLAPPCPHPPTPPPSWELSPSPPRHPTYPPLYPLLKQTIKLTHTPSQKPKPKHPHLNLSAATPITALPQSPPARPGPPHSLQLSLPLCSGTTHKPLPAALAHSHRNPSGLLS